MKPGTSYKKEQCQQYYRSYLLRLSNFIQFPTFVPHKYYSLVENEKVSETLSYVWLKIF